MIEAVSEEPEMTVNDADPQANEPDSVTRRTARAGALRRANAADPRLAPFATQRGVRGDRHARAQDSGCRKQLADFAHQISTVPLLQTIPGVGLLTATALVALVGDIHRFRTARHFASFLGLTPKEYSSASRRRVGAISKQGDVYLRTLLVQAARSVLWRARVAPQPTGFQRWARSTHQRRGHNIAAVAVANKLARIAWAV